MPATATDVETDNILKKYERRPKALEKLCLADFAAWYTFKKVEHHDESQSNDNDELYDSGHDDHDSDHDNDQDDDHDHDHDHDHDQDYDHDHYQPMTMIIGK